jgi:ATP synthase F1 delta subunit
MQEIYRNSEQFRLFTENGGVGSKEIAKLNIALKETAPFSDTTIRFLTVLTENKRLSQINDIAEKYAKLYQEFNKEEKITIISASDLTDDQKSQVVQALQANPQNEGKQFTIDYEVDDTILGGLQMYTESEFMDMSLSSRLDRISSEVGKLGN